MSRYEVLSTDSKCYYVNGTALLLSKSALTKDNEKDAVLIQLKFRSLYKKNVASLCVMISGMDLEGVIVEKKQFQYNDLNVSKYEEFGDRIPIYLDYKNIRKYSIYVDKIIFQDGSVESVINGMCMAVPEEQFPFNDELKDQYIRTISEVGGSPKAICTPLEFGCFWKCSCGTVNAEGDSECYSCKCSKEGIFDNLNGGTLSTFLNEYKIREAKDAEEKKQKQALIIKKAMVACLAALAVVAFLLVYKGAISPALSYNRAIKCYEEGDYENAVAYMSRLGDYKDAPDQVKKFKYDQATAMLDSGDINGAKAIFSEIKDYSDSEERINAILKEEGYNDAVSKMENGQYEDALSVFEKDLEYRESNYYAGCIYQEQGEYNHAIQCYEKVSEVSDFYKDAIARKDECAEILQEKADTYHYNQGVELAKKGYLFSAKKEFTESNGKDNAHEYLDIINDVMEEGWLGVYYSEEAVYPYIGIFCKINSNLEKTYVVTKQDSSFQSSYAGCEVQDDGTMLVYDTFNDSVDIKYDKGFIEEAEFRFQKDKAVYKKKNGTRGYGSFGKTKNLTVLSKNEDGFSEYIKTETTKQSNVRVDSYSAGGGKKTSASAEPTITTSENLYEFTRIGDEEEK